MLDYEKISIIINHSPSRVGGEKSSEPLRIAAAKLCKKIVDSLYNIDSNARIIVMGDFNDNPDNTSINKYLNAKHNRNNLKNNDLYNTMWDYYKKGLGTIAYKDTWNLFDQIIISNSLLNADTISYRFLISKIFNRSSFPQMKANIQAITNEHSSALNIPPASATSLRVHIPYKKKLIMQI